MCEWAGLSPPVTPGRRRRSRAALNPRPSHGCLLRVHPVGRGPERLNGLAPAGMWSVFAPPHSLPTGCGGRTRTDDLRVMSPASYQLLHPALAGHARIERSPPATSRRGVRSAPKQTPAERRRGGGPDQRDSGPAVRRGPGHVHRRAVGNGDTQVGCARATAHRHRHEHGGKQGQHQGSARTVGARHDAPPNSQARCANSRSAGQPIPIEIRTTSADASASQRRARRS
mgnify:FL=1